MDNLRGETRNADTSFRRAESAIWLYSPTRKGCAAIAAAP
jgi:hypothetical protein